MEGRSAVPLQQDGQVASPRRAPSQQRSRERVERMLAAASALIAEQGSDAMRMGEVAERAGVSIGSLYQFFPDKRAIVWALAERYTAESQACISAGAEGRRRRRRPAAGVFGAGRYLLPAVPGRAGDARHLVGHAGRQGAARARTGRQPRQCRIPDRGAEAAATRTPIRWRWRRRRFWSGRWARPRCGWRSRSTGRRATGWSQPTSAWR